MNSGSNCQTDRCRKDLPVLSAQLITAPTGKPRDILNLAPAVPPRPAKHNLNQKITAFLKCQEIWYQTLSQRGKLFKYTGKIQKHSWMIKKQPDFMKLRKARIPLLDILTSERKRKETDNQRLCYYLKLNFCW